ncbi:MAG: tyrosine-type recombinase/integrase [Acidobacteria bacterium]|nr:tyrosine-type recombinase/integrase [Acidobacteriota bacterium]
MPKILRDALTDVKVRQAKPKDKPYKLLDGGGLFLWVTPKGSKLWRKNFLIDGRWNTLSFGAYPTVSLKEAREKRSEADKIRAGGGDPSKEKKARKAAREADQMTFEVVARELHAQKAGHWTALSSRRFLRWMERDVFPSLGALPVRDRIEARDILEVCRRVEQKSAYSAHRILGYIGSVMRYAVATGRASWDPTSALRGALKPHREKHLAAITDPREIGKLLQALDGYSGYPATRAALRLSPLLMLRPGEVRRLEWAHVDLDNAEIRIPAEKMKMRRLHIVPLSRQAVGILREIQPLTGSDRYVFPSARGDGRPMSENTVRAALIHLGYPGDVQTAHGFRSMASTLLNEMEYPGDAVERQLAHANRDKVKAAYDHAEHLSKRRRMMQDWADHLDRLKKQ